eukprot:2317821-Pyramimonas_sp.AAC.2
MPVWTLWWKVPLEDVRLPKGESGKLGCCPKIFGVSGALYSRPRVLNARCIGSLVVPLVYTGSSDPCLCHFIDFYRAVLGVRSSWVVPGMLI